MSLTKLEAHLMKQPLGNREALELLLLHKERLQLLAGAFDVYLENPNGATLYILEEKINQCLT